MKRRIQTILIFSVCVIIMVILVILSFLKSGFFSSSTISDEISEKDAKRIDQISDASSVDQEKYYLGYPVFEVLLQENSEYTVQYIMDDQSVSDLYAKCETIEKDYFWFTFEPNVEYEFHLAYILKDDELNSYREKEELFLNVKTSETLTREIPVAERLAEDE